MLVWVWFGFVWLGLVWDNIRLKLLWMFHQDLTIFGCFSEDLMVVWFGMVWLGMDRFGWRENPFEASVKVSSRSNLFWQFWRRFSVGFVWFWSNLLWLSLVRDNIHLKLLWKFHKDPTCFDCFREDSVLVWFGMVLFGLVWILYG